MSSGIQNNRTVKVDVVYTKLGRYYRSINSEKAKITKWALGDDGIDYSLWDDNLPEDKAIKKITEIPLLSSWTEGSSNMNSRLLSLPLSTQEVSSFDLNPDQVSIRINAGISNERKVSTVNINANFASPSGFNIILNDARFLRLETLRATTLEEASTQNVERSTDTQRSLSTTQNLFLSGINEAPSVLSFNIVYDSRNNIFRSTEPLETTVIVESLDLGFRREVDVVLERITEQLGGA